MQTACLITYAARAFVNKQEKGNAMNSEIGGLDGDTAEPPARAEHDTEHAKDFIVDVLYNGVKKRFDVRPHETVKHLLDKATQAFGPIQNPHLLSLYKDGTELVDSQILKEAGVKPDALLLLRPSAVKGGA